MTSPEQPVTFQLRDYLYILRRRWLVVAVVVAVVVGVVLVATFATTPRYRAGVDVPLDQLNASAELRPGLTAFASTADEEIGRARSAEVVEAVRADVGREPSLSVGAEGGPPEGERLVFRATSASAERAATAVNRHVEEFLAHRRDVLVSRHQATAEVLSSLADDAADQIDSLREDQMAAEGAVASDEPDREAVLATIRADYDRQIQALELQRRRHLDQLDEVVLLVELLQEDVGSEIATATAPGSPFEPTPRRNLALGLAAGLILGIGGAFLVDHLRPVVRSDGEVEWVTGGLPVLATLPLRGGRGGGGSSRVVVRDEPRSEAAEDFRVLRAAVHGALEATPANTVAVTGMRPGDGATTAASNLAVAMARSGRRVVLIDADLHAPRLHEVFGLENSIGLSDMLRDGAGVADVARPVEAVPDLSVVTAGAGAGDLSDRLFGPSSRELLSALAARSDLVIFDTPPVLSSSDTLAVASMVDGVILVTSAQRSGRDDLEEAVRRLERSGARLLGTALGR